jgi:hypothetical protein
MVIGEQSLKMPRLPKHIHKVPTHYSRLLDAWSKIVGKKDITSKLIFLI